MEVFVRETGKKPVIATLEGQSLKYTSSDGATRRVEVAGEAIVGLKRLSELGSLYPASRDLILVVDRADEPVTHVQPEIWLMASETQVHMHFASLPAWSLHWYGGERTQEQELWHLADTLAEGALDFASAIAMLDVLCANLRTRAHEVLVSKCQKLERGENTAD